ncbi:MAG: hypothetical protein GKC10_02890 [Methanosarcinales archaeon]|nr:hypothetical protein [Methanosarcinales archaeon]
MAAIAILFCITTIRISSGQETSFDTPQASAELMWRYIQAVDSVNSNLSAIDERLAYACAALSRTGLQGPGTSEILRDLSATGQGMVDAITIDANGTIVEVEPQEYQHIRGMDIGDQEHVKTVMDTRRPLGLDYISTVEGFDALAFTAPVFDEQGVFLGAASVLINSTEFFFAALAPFQPESGAKIGVMKPDGLVLYDLDSQQIGKNTFSDPLFQEQEEILALGRRMEGERTGLGTYEFANTTREALWTTIDFQGRQIRMVLNVDL